MSDRAPREETTEFKDFINQMKSNYLKRADFTGTKSTVLGMNEKSFDNQDTLSEENTKDLKFVGDDSPNIKISSKKTPK